MPKMTLDRDLLEAAVIGGSFYGGGGGGASTTGREMGMLALSIGDPCIVDIDEVPPDAKLLTVSAVGAPAAKGSHAKAYHYIKAVELFMKHSGVKVDGFITNECGGLATVNGWVQSAVFGIPVVDAPCNGRAHPIAVMGSMGLHALPGYISIQVGVGGNPDSGTYVEVLVRGTIDKASNMIRQAAVQAGGLVAVARNPVNAAYARRNGAVGAVKRCIALGQAMLEAGKASPMETIERAAEVSGGEVVCRGKVILKEIETKGGFDVGRVMVEGGYEVVFWNEYVTLERNISYKTAGTGRNPALSERLATFPDLIVTLDVSTGFPVSSADVAEGQEVAVITVPQSKLLLGTGAKDKSLYASIEEVTGKKIL